MAAGLAMLRRYSSVDHQYHHPTMHYPTHTNSDQLIGQNNTTSNSPNPVQAAWLSLVKRLRSNLGTNSSNSSSHHSQTCTVDSMSPSARNCRSLRRSISNDSSKRKASSSQTEACQSGTYKSVRNIYRKPSTRSRLVLQRSERGEALRQQFARSRPCFVEMWDDYDCQSNGNDDDDEAFGGSSTSGSSVDSSTASEDCLPRRKPSILRRPRSRSVPTFYNSPARHSKTDQHAQLTKQTSFKEEVDVIYYDDEEQPVTKLSRTCERLKDGLSLLLHLEEHDASDITDGEVDGDGQSDNNNTCSSLLCEITAPPESSSAETISKTTVRGASSGPVRRTVCGGKQAITLLIEISDKCLKNRTCVKAMSGGKTLMVMTYQAVGGPDSSNLHQYVEKINLPVTIDPYGVRAQVKKTGHLYIEAPLRLSRGKQDCS